MVFQRPELDDGADQILLRETTLLQLCRLSATVLPNHVSGIGVHC